MLGEVCLPCFGIAEVRDDAEQEVDEDEHHLDVVAGAGLRGELLLAEQKLGDRDQDRGQGGDSCRDWEMLYCYSLNLSITLHEVVTVPGEGPC